MKIGMYESKGQPQNPLTLKELFSKCRECASLALPPEQVEGFLQLAWDLELLKDIRELMAILCFVQEFYPDKECRGRNPHQGDPLLFVI